MMLAETFVGVAGVGLMLGVNDNCSELNVLCVKFIMKLLIDKS